MKSALGSAALLWITAVLQTTLVPRRWPLDLFLLLAALNALRRPPARAAAEGMVVGLVQDFAAGGLLGVNAFSKALAAHWVAWPQRRFSGYPVPVGAVLVFTATLVERLAKLLLFAGLGVATSGWNRSLVSLPALHALAAILLLGLGGWAVARSQRGSPLLVR